MRSSIPAYELVAPRNLESALEKLAREPGVWKPFAGGTDLMVLLEAGKLPHRKFLSIWKLPELRNIEITEDSIAIGALVTYTQIRSQSILQREFPLLCRAASETGSIATQNRGTIGGNIANASPAADTPRLSRCTIRRSNSFRRGERDVCHTANFTPATSVRRLALMS